MRTEHSEQLAVCERQARSQVRVQGSDDALALGSAHRGVEQPIGGGDLLGVGHAALVLRDEGQVFLKCPQQKVASESFESLRKTPEGVVGADRLDRAQADRTTVEPLGQPHDRHAGLRVARHDRPLDRRGAAPARQQRRMHVEHRVFGQQRLANQHPIGADDDVARGRADSLADLRRSEILRLQERDPELARDVGHRR
ncbi:unannotated protein [freshwater metagenome]|uniref:Unannotated protein n=1 Tax=freshwater metagenome TaxID=449393 RepID=A0A6J7CXA5_9ZZZZ